MQTADRVLPPPGGRNQGRDDTERAVVGRRDGKILGDREVVEPAAEVAKFNDTRGASSCWTLVENSQLPGRLPQPTSVSGSVVVLGNRPPKRRSR